MRVASLSFALVSLLFTAVTACGQTAAAAPEADDAAKQAALFERIRGGYYHPGKVALSCDATLDFSSVLAKLGDTESAKLMDGVKLHVTASDSTYAEITFAWPASFPADSRPQVEQGAKQVVGGFFQAYWPIVNAEVLPTAKDHPTVVGAAGGGYVITAAKGAGSSRLTVDADGLIRRVDSQLAPGQETSVTLSYTVSPNPKAGDRMRFSGLSVDRSAGSMRVQVTMKWDDQEIGGVYVPHRITVSIPGAFDVPVTFSGCTVKPDPAAVASPRP